MRCELRANGDRILSELVAVEGWHSSFDESNCAKLHVDVTFRRGLVGEEPEAKVRFEIAAKRAEVSFVFSQTEGIAVIQSSVDREAIPTGTLVRSSASNINVKGRVSASVSTAALNAGASGEVAGTVAKSADSQIESAIRPIMSRQFRDTRGFYSWEVSSSQAESPMYGKVWDAQAEPRLRFKAKNLGKIAPSSRIEVRCRREDLHISNIEMKGKKAITDRWKRNRMAAAEAAIRVLLEDRELNSGDLSEKFAGIQLADVLVDEEVR